MKHIIRHYKDEDLPDVLAMFHLSVVILLTC